MDKLPFIDSNKFVDVRIHYVVSCETSFSSSGPSSITGYTYEGGASRHTIHSEYSRDLSYYKQCFVEFKNKTDEPLQLILDVKELWKDGNVKQRSQLATTVALPGDKVGFYIQNWTFLTGVHVWSPDAEEVRHSIKIETVVATKKIDGSDNFSILRSLNMLAGLLIYFVPGVLIMLFSGLLGASFLNPIAIYPSRRKRFYLGHVLLLLVVAVVFLCVFILSDRVLSIEVCSAIYVCGLIPWCVAQYLIWSSRLASGESYIES